MKAIIQGEVHGSEKDREAVLNHGLESFDALVIEGRKPEIVVEYLTIGYAVFIIGYVMGSWLQSFLENDSGINLEKEAKRAGIGYDEEIDADIQTIYQMVPKWDKRFIGIGLILLLMLGFFGVSKPILVLYTSTIPLLYTGLVDYVGIRLRSGKRNQYMANQISDISEEEGYDEVIVVCGQSHLGGLTKELESHGWSVIQHDTRHWLHYTHLAMRKMKETWKSA